MKKLVFVLLVISYFLQWVFTVLQNLCEVLANGLSEICVSLENFIRQHAKEPAGNTDSTPIKKD